MKLRRSKPLSASKNKYSSLDIWLTRASYISQVILVIAAIFGYWYTVRPVHQKEILDEDIAHKVIELNNVNKSLIKSYAQLRSQIVDSYIIEAIPSCTGTSVRPLAFTEFVDGSVVIPHVIGNTTFTLLNTSKCLKNILEKRSDIKKLKLEDYQQLSKAILSLSNDLETRYKEALVEFNELPKKSTLDPSILKPLFPLDPRSIELESKKNKITSEQYKAIKYENELAEGLSDIVKKYTEDASNQIRELRNTKWSEKK